MIDDEVPIGRNIHRRGVPEPSTPLDAFKRRLETLAPNMEWAVSVEDIGWGFATHVLRARASRRSAIVGPDGDYPVQLTMLEFRRDFFMENLARHPETLELIAREWAKQASEVFQLEHGGDDEPA